MNIKLLIFIHILLIQFTDWLIDFTNEILLKEQKTIKAKLFHIDIFQQ